MVVQAPKSSRFDLRSFSRSAAKIRRADGQLDAGESSEDEDGWRVAERYCIDYRAAFDLDEIIENVFMRATESMHQSGMRMDADHVGKPQDLYLWCLAW